MAALLERAASYGPDHRDVATRLNSLAFLLQATHRLAEAGPLLSRALEILLAFTRATRHEHPKLRDAGANSGSLLAAMGQTPEQIHARLDEVGRPFGMSLGD